MAVDKITFADKVSMIESTLPVINRIRDIDVNEIKDVVNNNADELTGTQTITTGTGNASPTYISSVENNHYEKVGKVVSYSFTMTASGTWTTTTQLISGLPKAAANTRFSGTNTSNAERPVLRFIITTGGAIQNAYSQTSPVAGNVIEGHITYITSE